MSQSRPLHHIHAQAVSAGLKPVFDALPRLPWHFVSQAGAVSTGRNAKSASVAGFISIEKPGAVGGI